MDAHTEIHSQPPRGATPPMAGRGPNANKMNDANDTTTAMLGLVLEELRGLRGDVARLDGKVGQLEGKVGQLEGKIGELHGKIGDTKAELVGRIGDTNEKIGELHGKMGETKAELVGKIGETNEKMANDKMQITGVVIATAAVMFAALRYFGVG